MSMLPLYLHVNQKSDYDDEMHELLLYFVHLVCNSTLIYLRSHKRSWRIQTQFKVRPRHDYVDRDRNIK